MTRPTDNPVLAYEYRGGEAARHETRPIKRNGFSKGRERRDGSVSHITSPSVGAEGFFKVLAPKKKGGIHPATSLCERFGNVQFRLRENEIYFVSRTIHSAFHVALKTPVAASR